MRSKLSGGLTPPEAIRSLFSIELSEHKGFKDLVYPLVRSKGFLDIHKEHMGGSSNKHHLLISRDSLDKLYNAVLLQGFFADSKRVRSIFSDEEKRAEATELLTIIFSNRQSSLGIAIQSDQLAHLIEIMKSNISLCEIRLPNPFAELPQLSLNGLTSIMQALLAQSAVLTHGETMMAHYLNGDLEKANNAACALNSDDPTIVKYQLLIHAQYQQAKEFDNLLDNLLN